jgi:hypothetical protein
VRVDEVGGGTHLVGFQDRVGDEGVRIGGGCAVGAGSTAATVPVGAQQQGRHPGGEAAAVQLVDLPGHPDQPADLLRPRVQRLVRPVVVPFAVLPEVQRPAVGGVDAAGDVPVRGEPGDGGEDVADDGVGQRVELQVEPRAVEDDGADGGVEAGAGGVPVGGGTVQPGDPHGDVEPAGGVSDGDDRGMTGGEQGQGDGEVLVVDRLAGHVVPGLAGPVGPTALAQVEGVDGVAEGVEVFGDVGLEEEVGHAVDEQQCRPGPPGVVGHPRRKVADEGGHDGASGRLLVGVVAEDEGVRSVARTEQVGAVAQVMDGQSHGMGQDVGEGQAGGGVLRRRGGPGRSGGLSSLSGLSGHSRRCYRRHARGLDVVARTPRRTIT